MNYDVAVLKIENSEIYASSNAKPATIGQSGDMSVGDTVIAIGNPEDEGIAVSAGILSVESEYIDLTAADEVTTVSHRVMRFDAAINGGNSGGGLFNDSGELVGIVHAKTIDEEIEGMAYAIPIDLAYAAAKNIIANCDGVNNTQIMRCIIGIGVQVTDAWTEVDDVTGKVSVHNALTIVEVTDGSVAETAGVEVGDIIESVRYKSYLYKVERDYDITNLSLLFAEGDSVILNIVRNGESISLEIIMGEATAIK